MRSPRCAARLGNGCGLLDHEPDPANAVIEAGRKMEREAGADLIP